LFFSSPVNTVVGRKILGRFGYTDDMVDVAFDGQQALQAAERQRYDLILMVRSSFVVELVATINVPIQDLSMPIMDGIAARKRIEASPLTGSPRIVALTANTDKDTRDLCADFFAYLGEPLWSWEGKVRELTRAPSSTAKPIVRHPSSFSGCRTLLSCLHSSPSRISTPSLRSSGTHTS
jgi:CheY-like chemotaxis protein